MTPLHASMLPSTMFGGLLFLSLRRPNTIVGIPALQMIRTSSPLAIVIKLSPAIQDKSSKYRILSYTVWNNNKSSVEALDDELSSIYILYSSKAASVGAKIVQVEGNSIDEDEMSSHNMENSSVLQIMSSLKKKEIKKKTSEVRISLLLATRKWNGILC
jgi:hypothetical protein